MAVNRVFLNAINGGNIDADEVQAEIERKVTLYQESQKPKTFNNFMSTGNEKIFNLEHKRHMSDTKPTLKEIKPETVSSFADSPMN